MRRGLFSFARFLCVVIAGAVISVAPAIARADRPESDAFITDLIVQADEMDKKIGEVRVWNDETQLFVKYLITQYDPNDPSDNWCLTRTRLAVEISVGRIPQHDGSAVPGRFTYQDNHDCVTEYTYTVPFPSPSRSRFAIAANASVMRIGGVAGLPYLLPSSGKMTVANSPTVPESNYFDITVSEDTFLNGVHRGWCVDSEHSISSSSVYDVKFYSSYGPIPAGLIDHPENLDRVNWILNQGYVGRTSPGGFGVYTAGDVQIAIWSLIDDDNTGDSSTDPSSPDRIAEILAAAAASGGGFVPRCDQVVGIILAPTSPTGERAQTSLAQTVFTTLNIPCHPISAKVWGEGRHFPCRKGSKCDQDGSMYFIYRTL